jgi:two-component system cell cycle response regulator DivK
MASSEPSTDRGGLPAEMPKSVLVIEDNAINRRLFEAMLSTQGYNVIEALDGPSGLKTAQDKRPDLIILDVQLPGMAGLEVRRRLREAPETRHIPILVATAEPMPNIEQEVRASEYDGYMAKPIAVSEFLTLVDWLLLRSQIAADSAV